MTSLVDYIVKHVPAGAYYEQQFPDIRWSSGGEGRVLCPFHAEKTPSMHVNRENGKWHCHGCGEGGKSIVSFHANLTDASHTVAAEDIYDNFVRPIIPERVVLGWHRALPDNPRVVRYLRNERCLSNRAIADARLGWDGHNITIPIRNEFGYYVNAKLYRGPNAKPKMLNYSTKADRDSGRSYGRPMLYPLDVFALATRKGYIIVAEGEWDTLALLAIGVPAITSTGGCKSWAPEYNELFRGLQVFVAYDNDSEGDDGASRVARELRHYAKSVRRIRIPSTRGRKDVLDWIKSSPRMRKAKGWEAVLQNATSMGVTNTETASPDVVHEVNVTTASRAEYNQKRIRMDAVVQGKVYPPFILPKKWRCTCAKTCDNCPLKESGADFHEVEINGESPLVMDMLAANKEQLKPLLLKTAKIHPKPGCFAQVEEVEWMNVERIAMRPTLDSGADSYSPADGFYVGHNLKSNRAYTFEGQTLANPRSRTAAHLLTTATPAQGDVDGFQMTPELNRQLRLFRPRGRMRNVAHLHTIADWQAEHITRIWQRPDLHIMADLVFHSTAAFHFNGEFVRRGMLDVLIVGDTRCGKGYVAEGLLKYYGLGEVASGENCSFAGLVGGCQQIGNQWVVTWGAIPLNNGRLVVIDETSALSHDEIGRMSRVRSEGVAEITKIVQERTHAKARLLWLGNPRDGRPIMEYGTGVDAVKELVGANEDISRFDCVLTVATDEVPGDVINAPAHGEQDDADKYPRHLCRALLLWAWSRRPDQIRFTERATKTVLRCAMHFAKRYSPRVPIVQSENIRLKIAKMAAAVAARTYSASADGETLEVHYGHVLCARQIMEDAYRKPSLAYDHYSERVMRALRMDDPEAVRVAINAADPGDGSGLRGLVDLSVVRTDRLADYLGDEMTAKKLVSELVRLNCLIATAGGYAKTQAFGEWLRRENRKR